MAKNIDKLNYTMFSVAFCCLVTAVLLELWTGSEQQKTVVLSPVLSDITWKDDDKTRYIGAKSVVDTYDAVKKWTIVKYLAAIGSYMIMVAMVMTLVQNWVKDTSVYRTMDFISNVLIIVSGIYLCICILAHISVASDPESEYQMDETL